MFFKMKKSSSSLSSPYSSPCSFFLLFSLFFFKYMKIKATMKCHFSNSEKKSFPPLSSPPLRRLIHDDWVVVDCFQLCWHLVLIGLLWLVEANKKSIYDRYGKEGLTGSSGGRGECVTTVCCALKKEILTATEGNCGVSTTLSIGRNLNMATFDSSVRCFFTRSIAKVTWKLFISTLQFAGRDGRDLVISSLWRKVQDYDWTKEETDDFKPIIKEMKKKQTNIEILRELQLHPIDFKHLHIVIVLCRNVTFVWWKSLREKQLVKSPKQNIRCRESRRLSLVVLRLTCVTGVQEATTTMESTSMTRSHSATQTTSSGNSLAAETLSLTSSVSDHERLSEVSSVWFINIYWK